MLPKIAAYELPSNEQEFENRVAWPAIPQRSALLVHDMQRYFLAPFGDSPLRTHLVGHVASIITCAHELGIPVFYTAQPPRQDPQDRGLLTDFWGPGLQEDHAAEIIPELTPQENDTVLTKWRYDAFARSNFAELLAAAGRDQLVITGIYSSIGITATATSAFMRDIQAFLVSDATADFSAEQHRDALHRASQHCARVVTTDTLLADWQVS
ncbi:MAG: isochorismatase family protein [Corynebacterium sp.]|nr:isochorismatase family protein [Corynebacterium sp.]